MAAFGQGVYFGRSDTGKCRLPDQQVERLMRGREQQRHGAEDALQALIAADPYQGENRAHPHLFIVARPGVRPTEMCRDLIAADAGFRLLLSLRTAVINEVTGALYSATPQAPDSVLSTLMNPRPITGGVALMSLSAQSSGDEQRHRELRIDEDGDLSLYHSCVGWDAGSFNAIPGRSCRPREGLGARYPDRGHGLLGVGLVVMPVQRWPAASLARSRSAATLPNLSAGAGTCRAAV